jgi:hypothetical protein
MKHKSNFLQAEFDEAIQEGIAEFNRLSGYPVSQKNNNYMKRKKLKRNVVTVLLSATLAAIIVFLAATL